MIIISDTTPIRYLVEIEKAHILEELFGKIIIPEKVFLELQGRRTPPKVIAWIQAHPDWIEIRHADTSLVTTQKKIGPGEIEAFALALELKADAVLLDDKDATTEAERLHIEVIATFNILESAAEKNLIDLPATIQEMQSTSFRLPPQQLIDEMLERDRIRKLGSSPE
jgi:predicted nucleic acid-binding protein